MCNRGWLQARALFHSSVKTNPNPNTAVMEVKLISVKDCISAPHLLKRLSLSPLNCLDISVQNQSTVLYSLFCPMDLHAILLVYSKSKKKKRENKANPKPASTVKEMNLTIGQVGN